MRAGRSGEHKDWATIGRGKLLGWGLPVIAMIGAGAVELREVVWPVALAWMGAACLANARRCGRVHCFFTGPFLLAMAALALMVGLGIVSLGARGWTWIGGGAFAGAALLYFLPERVWGRYFAGR